MDGARSPMSLAKDTLTWLGGNPGDGWYEMSIRIVKLINRDCANLTVQLIAGGGRSNVEKIQSGEADIGLSIDVVASAARNGGAPFAEPMLAINCIGTGWSALPYNLLGGARGPCDLNAALRQDGLRFGAPPEDTTDELVFRRVLAFCGTSYRDIAGRGGQVMLDGYDALVSALGEGRIDYVFGATTLPAQSIARAETASGLRLLRLPENVIAHLANDWGHSSGVIPSSIYPRLCQDGIATSFVQTVILTSVDVPESHVYFITKTLLQRREELHGIHESV